MTEFNSINTPSDLIEFNKQPVEKPEMSQAVSDILDLVYAEDPAEGLEIVQHILGCLSDYHKDAVKGYTEQGKAHEAAVWAYDVAVIDMARENLKGIAL